MAITEDLFELVGTFSKSEKRYCRLYIKQRVGREASNLLCLFDAVIRQPDRDNAQLRKQLAGASFLNHLSVTKAHLYKLLLKALRSYTAGSSERWQLFEMVDAVLVLYERNLLSQARRMIDQTSELAQRVERPIIQLILLDIDDGINSYGLYRDDNGRDMRRMYLEGKRLIKMLENSWEYRNIHARLLRLMSTEGMQREGPSKRRLDAAVRRHPLLQDESTALSVGARLEFYNALVGYYKATGDYREVYRVINQQIRYIESTDDALLQSSYQITCEALYEHIEACVKLGKMEEAYASFRRLCEPDQTGDKAKDDITVLCYKAETIICGGEGNYDRLIALGSEIEEYLMHSRSSEKDWMAQCGYINAAYAHIMKEEYREAISWLAKIRNDSETPLRADFEVLVRIYRIISHYEVGDIDILPYLLRSFYRFLHSRNRLHRFEQIILCLLRKLPSIVTSQELIEVFRIARDELDEIKSDPREWESSLAPMIIPWLDSKIDRIPVFEAARIRNEQVQGMAARV